MISRVFYQLHVTLHLLPIREGSVPERSPATAVMRRAIIRSHARGLTWSATLAMVEDIELTTALGEEDVTLLYPTPHEYCR